MKHGKQEYSVPEVVSYGSIVSLTAATEQYQDFDGNYSQGDDIPDEDDDGLPEIGS